MWQQLAPGIWVCGVIHSNAKAMGGGPARVVVIDVALGNNAVQRFLIEDCGSVPCPAMTMAATNSGDVSHALAITSIDFGNLRANVRWSVGELGGQDPSFTFGEFELVDV